MSGVIWSRSWPVGSTTVSLVVSQHGHQRQAAVVWSCGEPLPLEGARLVEYQSGLAVAKSDVRRLFGMVLPVSEVKS